MKHILVTPETCPCDKQSDTPCNVCDGGLVICSVCGNAEAELDGPCKPKHRYSYSQLTKYAQCPTKYLHHYVNQLVPLTAGSEHDLSYGKAIDAALNAYYQTGNILLGLAAFGESYPLDEYPASLPYWSPGKTYQNGINALEAYADTYRDEDSHWTPLQIQSVGTGAESEVDEVDDDRTVILDLVVRDDRDELVYGVDNKSTGKYLDKDYSAKFEIHSQIRQYVDYIQKTWGKCGGFYINALSFRHRTKAYTPRQGPDKGVQLPAGDWFSFKRMLFNPNSEAIRLERANWVNWVAKIESDKEHGTWAYNTEQCVRGPIVCEFHGICSNGYQWPRDADLITNNYRQQCRVLVDGRRCWLAPEHEGEHDATRPVVSEPEFDLDDDTVEEAAR